MDEPDQLKRLLAEADALFQDAAQSLPNGGRDHSFHVRLEIVPPGDADPLPDDHEASASLRDGRRDLSLLAEEEAQHDQFYRLSGMRAHRAARKALTELRIAPAFPLSKKGLADLWNSSILYFEAGRLRLSHHRLRILLVAGFVWEATLLIPMLMFLTLWWFDERRLSLAGAAYPLSILIVAGMMMYAWWDAFVPVIRAKKLQPLLGAVGPP